MEELTPGFSTGADAEIHNGYYEIVCEFKEQREGDCYEGRNKRKTHYGKDYGGTGTAMASGQKNNHQDSHCSAQDKANRTDKACYKFKEKEIVGMFSKFVPWYFDFGLVLTDAVEKHKSASTAEPEQSNHNSQSNQQTDCTEDYYR